MTENKLKSKLEQATGSVKQGLGKLTGDKKTEVEGLIEKTSGKAKELAGDAKDAVDGAVQGIKNLFK